MTQDPTPNVATEPGDALLTDRPIQQVDLLHDPGIVYQYIDPSVAVLNSLLKRQHIRAYRYVAADRLDSRIPCLEFTERHFIPRACDHLGALGSELYCELATDTRCSASHHSDAVAPRSAFRMQSSHRSGTSACSCKAFALIGLHDNGCCKLEPCSHAGRCRPPSGIRCRNPSPASPQLRVGGTSGIMAQPPPIWRLSP